jgi:hypothetical protein
VLCELLVSNIRCAFMLAFCCCPCITACPRFCWFAQQCIWCMCASSAAVHGMDGFHTLSCSFNLLALAYFCLLASGDSFMLQKGVP